MLVARAVSESVPRTGADQRHAVLAPRGDEYVTGVVGMARLDAVDPRHGADERVEVGHVALWAGLQHRPGLRDRAGEERRVTEVVLGEPDEVGGARVVARRVEPDRGGVVRVLQAELARLGVHHRDERADRAVADVVGEVLGRVVGAGQHHRDEQIVDGHPVTRPQADLRVRRRLVVVGVGEDGLQVVHVLQHDQRRHQLRRRRDRALAAGGHPVQHLPGRGRVQRRGGDGERGRRLGRRGCRGDAQRDHPADQRRRRGRGAAPHRRSLSRVPVCSALGETFGFSRVSWASGTWVAAAIPLRVSPALTT